jgi:hypothetical protein
MAELLGPEVHPTLEQAELETIAVQALDASAENAFAVSRVWPWRGRIDDKYPEGTRAECIAGNAPNATLYDAGSRKVILRRFTRPDASVSYAYDSGNRWSSGAGSGTVTHEWDQGGDTVIIHYYTSTGSQPSESAVAGLDSIQRVAQDLDATFRRKAPRHLRAAGLFGMITL